MLQVLQDCFRKIATRWRPPLGRLPLAVFSATRSPLAPKFEEILRPPLPARQRARGFLDLFAMSFVGQMFWRPQGYMSLSCSVTHGWALKRTRIRESGIFFAGKLKTTHQVYLAVASAPIGLRTHHTHDGRPR